MLRRTKAEVERYVASVQAAASSPRERSLKGFFFAKLYFGIKEYELAQRHLSIYLHVRERDPKAHRFLGQIYEAQDNVEKACGCYERSVELNPMQKDLVLKIAELLSNHNITDERAKYWVEKAARLFPGNPAAYRLKEQLLERKGEAGWNQLLDMIRTELCARPDDLYLNIRLVALYRSNNKLRDAVLHCQEVEKKIPVDSSLEWCLCVIKTFEEYLESVRDLESDRNNWRAIKKDHLLAYSSLVKMTLASRDVQESRGALESFDRVLHSVKLCVNGPDELSRAFLEMKGHFYMHAGTFLLKMAQNSEAQWRDACELAALCYLKSFHIPKPKSKPVKGDGTGQDLLEMLACDRKSQSGHMLLNLSHSKEDFLKKIVENFANKRGLFTLFESLFGSGASKERSFLGTDDIGDVSTQAPVQEELSEYDIGAVRMHSGSLQHLVWLGLQWNSMSVLFPLRKLLERLFHLPQETSKLETDAPDSICLLDLEVFLLGMVFTGNLELQEKLNTRCGTHQPPFLPLLLCKQYCTEKQRSWWDAVCTLMQKKTIPDSVTKLRLLVQHGLSTLRALEKHGLQPALIMHWARSLQKTGISLNSFCDQKQYIGRSVYYWKKTLLSLKTIKKHKSIPEPTDPLFKHFRSVDIQVAAYEEEAHIAFATLDAVEGKTDDALLAFEAIKNVVSYWNLAILCQRKAKEIENDAMLPEQREEHKTYLLKRKHYLMKVIDESSCDPSVANKLPVSVKTVTEMLNAVIQELGENEEEESLASGNISQAAGLEVKYSTPSPKRLSFSPANNYKFSPKTLPQWAEDQKSLLQMLSQQVEALKNEIQEMKRNRSGVSISSHGWPGESYGTDTVSAGYERAQNLHEVPVTVATSGPSVDYSRSPAYNSRHLLRTSATNVTPTKVRTNVSAQAVPANFLKTTGFDSLLYQCVCKVLRKPIKSSLGFHPQHSDLLFRKLIVHPLWISCSGSCKTGRQVVKLRANHRTAADRNMRPVKGSDRAWVWTACNFGDRGRKVELLAVRFKRQDVAGSFKQTCDEAKQLWSTSETPQKPVVSPAKFVFQAESVKSVFSSEKTFPFGNTSAPSSLFGFGVHPPRKSAASQKAEQEKPGAAEPPKSCGAPQKPLEGKASQLEASSCSGSCKTGRQVVKLRANHRTAADRNMRPVKGSDRAWVWTACNFGDRGRKVELLAVRFKRQDVAGSFKQTCDEAKQAHETGTLITPRVSRTNTARASPCGKDAVAGLEGTGRVAADLSLGDAASDAAAEASELWSTSETPQKPVVSPAKFVFQAESVKSVFSSEKTFPFGNTSAPSSLFGFGVHPPRKSAASQKAEQEKPGAAEPPKSCGAPQKPLEGKASQLAPAAQDGPSNFSFKILEKEIKETKRETFQLPCLVLLFLLFLLYTENVLMGFSFPGVGSSLSDKTSSLLTHCVHPWHCFCGKL
uniref:RanBD1 domain-containing protein n=1 Tax=Gallus gallus TaxID=9031 RepID=A0A8V1A6S9_CHICK